MLEAKLSQNEFKEAIKYNDMWKKYVFIQLNKHIVVIK